MRKIPTLFLRDLDNHARLTREVHPDCGWVLADEGEPTVKWDGVCVMLDHDGAWWSRREFKPGKALADNFVPVQYDAATGKTFGWEPIAQAGIAKHHAEALTGDEDMPGTYELVGPKIHGNPGGHPVHSLIRHGLAPRRMRDDVATAPRDFDGLREWLRLRPQYEGIVWHHPDGRMAKLKREDFAPREHLPNRVRGPRGKGWHVLCICEAWAADPDKPLREQQLAHRDHRAASGDLEFTRDSGAAE